MMPSREEVEKAVELCKQYSEEVVLTPQWDTILQLAEQWLAVKGLPEKELIGRLRELTTIVHNSAMECKIIETPLIQIKNVGKSPQKKSDFIEEKIKDMANDIINQCAAVIARDYVPRAEHEKLKKENRIFNLEKQLSDVEIEIAESGIANRVGIEGGTPQMILHNAIMLIDYLEKQLDELKMEEKK